MKLFYYKVPEGNFGDDLNAWLWEELAPGIWDDTSEVAVSGIGTILGDQMPPSPRWIVMGSGAGYTSASQDFTADQFNILCVRGPLTAMALGLPLEKAVTDSAMLIALLPQYRPLEEDKRSGTVFMPHHTKIRHFHRWKAACEEAGIGFLDPTADSKQLLERIRSAKLVLADAMHAAITADAMRVPWLPIIISQHTNSFKWLDWTLSMNLRYEPVRLATSSLAEELQFKVSTALGYGNTFSDLSVAGARKYFIRLEPPAQNQSKGGLKATLKKSAGALKTLSHIGFVRRFYEKLDGRHFAQTVDSLRRAALMKPMLSDDVTFQRRKNQMAQHLEALKALGKSGNTAYTRKVIN